MSGTNSGANENPATSLNCALLPVNAHSQSITELAPAMRRFHCGPPDGLLLAWRFVCRTALPQAALLSVGFTMTDRRVLNEHPLSCCSCADYATDVSRLTFLPDRFQRRCSTEHVRQLRTGCDPAPRGSDRHVHKAVLAAFCGSSSQCGRRRHAVGKARLTRPIKTQL